MKEMAELETLVKAYFSKLPLSTDKDTIDFYREDGATGCIYTYDGPSYSTAKGNLRFKINDGMLCIDGIYINYNFRGRGYGKKLVELLESMAKELKMNQIVIENSTNNPFWEHMGYLQTSLKIKSYLCGWHKPVSNDL